MGARRQPAQPERQVVAVRPGQGEPPLDLAAAVRDQPLAEQLGQLGRIGIEAAIGPGDRGDVGDVDRVVPAGQALVGELDPGCERRHQPQPLGPDLGAGHGELLVPHLQRGQGAGRKPTAGAAQQGVALAEDPVVVLPAAVVPGQPLGGQGVEEPPALLRVAPDQAQVPGPRDGGTVHPPPDPRPRAQLDVDQQAPAGPPHGGANHRRRRPGPDQAGVLPDPVRAERGQVAGRLEQVRLADPVGPDQHRHPGRQVDRRPVVVPEVDDLQPLHTHASTLARRSATRARTAHPGRRTGISRYMNASASLPWIRAGLRPSRTSMTASLSSTAATPSLRYTGLKAMVSPSPSYLASTAAAPRPTSWRLPSTWSRSRSNVSRTGLLFCPYGVTCLSASSRTWRSSVATLSYPEGIKLRNFGNSPSTRREVSRRPPPAKVTWCGSMPISTVLSPARALAASVRARAGTRAVMGSCCQLQSRVRTASR